MKILNPDNVKPLPPKPDAVDKASYYDRDISERVPTILLILSILYLVVGLIGLTSTESIVYCAIMTMLMG